MQGVEVRPMAETPLRFCECGNAIESNRRRYCSNACKQRAYRHQTQKVQREFRLQRAERRALGRINYRFQFTTKERISDATGR